MTEPLQPALARITSPGAGTAFAISQSRALTAFHCVEEGQAAGGDTVDRCGKQLAAADVELRFTPTSAPVAEMSTRAKVIDGDSAQDWAVLALDPPLSPAWRPIPLNGTEVRAGDSFLVRGFPALVQQELTGPLTGQVVVTGETIWSDSPVVQLDAHIIAHRLDARGLSGGPVLSRDGLEAVALVVGRLLDDEEEQAGGVVFACPASCFADEDSVRGPAAPVAAVSGVKAELLERAATGDLGAAARIGALLRARGEDDLAEPWLRQAASGGDPAAAYSLGMSIDPRGDLIASDPDRAMEAFAWFRKAATGGDVYGMTTVGIRLRQRGSDQAALPWLEEAVERGGDAMAAHTLARIYADRGDVDRAESYERIAAEKGDIRAGFELGRMLVDRGERDEAIKWLRFAHGDPDAVTLLRALGVEP